MLFARVSVHFLSCIVNVGGRERKLETVDMKGESMGRLGREPAGQA